MGCPQTVHCQMRQQSGDTDLLATGSATRTGQIPRDPYQAADAEIHLLIMRLPDSLHWLMAHRDRPYHVSHYAMCLTRPRMPVMTGCPLTVHDLILSRTGSAMVFSAGQPVLCLSSRLLSIRKLKMPCSSGKWATMWSGSAVS